MTFLASSSCAFTHRNYSACAGRYARVFVGLSDGWLADADAGEPAAEDIESHLDELARPLTGSSCRTPSSTRYCRCVIDAGSAPMPDNADVTFPQSRKFGCRSPVGSVFGPSTDADEGGAPCTDHHTCSARPVCSLSEACLSDGRRHCGGER